MHYTFTNEPLYIDDVVVYLKNERTGSSTVRKCKFVGHIIDFTKNKINIRRLSPPDIFVTPDKIEDLGIDTVSPDDVVHVIISKHQTNSTTKLLGELNKIISERNKDIKFLLGSWFCALEDEGVDPWVSKECIQIANKHWYTKNDYNEFLNTIY